MTTTHRLVILGAGGHGRVVADAADACGTFREVCFMDEQFPALSDADGWPVIGPWRELESLTSANDCFVVAIGNAQRRLELLDGLLAAAKPVVSIFHPSAVVSRRAAVDVGTVIFAGACVNIGARLSRGVIINTGATVDHHCTIAEAAHICPGAHLAGNVRVGRLSWVGIGASVRQGITIGEEVTIGAGAAVVSDQPSDTIAFGVPARPQGTR